MLEGIDFANQVIIRASHMDWVLTALSCNWNVHRCATVFEGEGRGIESTQIDTIVVKVDDCACRLNEGQSHNCVHRDMGAGSDENARCITVLGEIREVELKPNETKEFVFVLGYVENKQEEKWESKNIINKTKAKETITKFDTVALNPVTSTRIVLAAMLLSNV